MRWLLSSAVALLIATAASVPAAAAPTASAARATRVGCVLKTSARGSVVSAAGSCKFADRVLPVRWSYSYLLFDSAGNACGRAPTVGNGRRFTVSEGVQAAAYSVRISSRVPVNGRFLSKTVRGRITPGGDDLECGKLGRLPLPTGELCAWPALIDPFPDYPCGVPNEWVSWSSPPTLTGNVVYLGHVASRSGFCYRTSSPVGDFSPPSARDWVGAHLVGRNLRCSDGIFARIAAITLGLVNPSGQSCVATVLADVWRFPVPASWGGTLYLSASLESAFDFRTPNPQPVAEERTTAAFPLDGTEDGCPALTSTDPAPTSQARPRPPG